MNIKRFQVVGLFRYLVVWQSKKIIESKYPFNSNSMYCIFNIVYLIQYVDISNQAKNIDSYKVELND